MGGIAFVFSGQGDQFPGMGKHWYERSTAAKAVFDELETVRPGTMAQCFDGTREELLQTANTQPCLYAVEAAGAALLEARSIRAEAVAGFSLGEVAAAAVAGVFERKTGFELVCKRGQLMQRAAERQDTAMAAVVKLTAARVTKLCREFDAVYPVNFNGPEQVAVAGNRGAIPAFFARVREAGGRAIPLNVSGAFHSPFMREAADGFAEILREYTLREPELRLYSDLTGDVYGDDPARLLAEQIANPVRWETIVRRLIADGITTFIEIGPGRTLGKLIQKLDADVSVLNVDDILEQIPEET